MNVASLELCKELYELSGWEEVNWAWFGKKLVPKFDYEITPDLLPAYDLGYMLRKLPVQINKDGVKHWLSLYPLDRQVVWGIGYSDDMGPTNEDIYGTWAENVEDATAKLAIELFKQGVLTKS